MKTTIFNKLACCLLTVFMATFISSCGDDDEKEPDYLTVSKNEITVDATGGTQKITVNSNCRWSANSPEVWVNVIETDNGKDGEGFFEIRVQEKVDLGQRECTIKVKSVNGSVEQSVRIIQNGVEPYIKTFESSLRFTGEKGSSKALEIESNVEWTISGIPDWIDAERTSGKNGATIMFKTLSSNDRYADDRKATIHITDKEKTVDVAVDLIQSSLLASCSVTPSGLTALNNSVAYLPNAVGQVKRFKAGYILASAFNSWSEAEIREFARGGDAFTEFNTLHAMHGLRADTEYYLVTLAYDFDDKEGEVKTTKFKTRPAGDNQAFVSIDDVYRSDNDYVWWIANPDGATDKYYTIYLNGLSDDEFYDFLYIMNDDIYYDKAKLAWIINNEINNKSSNYKVKKGYAEIVEEKGYNLVDNKIVARGQSLQLGWCVCVAWGVNVFNDQLSGYLSLDWRYLGLDSASGQQIVTKPDIRALRSKIKNK